MASKERSAHQAAMYKLIAEYLGSGLKQQAFCKKAGLPRSTFQRWLRLYRQSADTASPGREAAQDFLPVALAPAAGDREESTEAEGCYLHYPNGVRLYFPCSVFKELLPFLINGMEG